MHTTSCRNSAYMLWIYDVLYSEQSDEFVLIFKYYVFKIFLCLPSSFEAVKIALILREEIDVNWT